MFDKLVWDPLQNCTVIYNSARLLALVPLEVVRGTQFASQNFRTTVLSFQALYDSTSPFSY